MQIRALVVLLAGLSACAPRARTPTFDDYRVTPTFQDRPAPVDLSSAPHAKRFRTRLTEAASAGPNFADHFTVATWGCGTSCHVMAIVDARSGKVTYAGGYDVGVSFRRDSRMLIVNPPDALAEDWSFPRDCNQPWVPSTTYLEWNGVALSELQTVKPCADR